MYLHSLSDRVGREEYFDTEIMSVTSKLMELWSTFYFCKTQIFCFVIT